MIICDECKSLESKTFECFIILEKVDETKQRKMKPREIIKIPVALCDSCITKVCKNLGTLKQKGELTKHENI